MNLRKSKKLVLKTLLAVLFASTVFASFTSANVAYAVHSCPTDWTPEETNKCVKDESTACPTTYIPSSESTDTRTVCIKMVASATDTQDLVNKATLLIRIQGFLNRLIWPILILTGDLMDNSLLFGGGMEEHLRDIWIPIRNIVNILFVIILVGIALYNVLGIGDENSEYSIKSVLPKIVIGIIAVNFSFLGIKVFLDAVNVLTVSVFALPGQVSEGLERIVNVNDDSSDSDKYLIKQFCARIQNLRPQDMAAPDEFLQQQNELRIYRTVGEQILGNNSINTMSKAEIQAAVAALPASEQSKKTEFDKRIEKLNNTEMCEANRLTDTGKQFLTRWNSHNAALALALNMGKIVFYEEVHFDSSNVEKMVTNTLFSLLLYLVYVVSFVALFVVLLARLVVLWLSIAVSPVLMLIMAVPTLKDKLKGFGEIEEKFVKNAIAPLLVALPMTVGWIMLKGIQGLNIVTQKDSFQVAISNGIPVVGLSTLQDLIVALATIGVVWIGVFSAAEGTLAQVATDAMKGFLENAGKWVGSLPFKHIPFIPVKVPGVEGEESYTGTQVLEGLKAIVQPGRTEKDLKLANLFRPGGASDPSEISGADTKDEVLRGISKASQAGKLDGAAYQNALKEYQASHGTDFTDLDASDKFDGALGRLADAKDDKARKEAAREIKKKIAANPALRAALPATKPGAAGKPAAPSGQPVQSVDENFDLGGGKGTVKNQYAGDEASLAAGINMFNDNTSSLGQRLFTLSQSKSDGKVSDNERTEIEGTIKQLRFNNQTPTKDKIKGLIGDDRFNYLKKVLGSGNDTQGDQALDGLLGGGAGTPPPVAPPAAPAAGTPPTP